MSAEPTSSRPDATSARPVFRRALRGSLIAMAVLAIGAPPTGWLVSGSRGLWGAGIGVAMAAAFSLATPLVMLATLRSSLVTVSGVVLGTWLAKFVAVIVVLALVRHVSGIDLQVLGAVLMLGVLVSLAADWRAVEATRVPTLNDRPRPPDVPEGESRR